MEEEYGGIHRRDDEEKEENECKRNWGQLLLQERMVSFLEQSHFDGLAIVFVGNDSLTRTTIALGLSEWSWTPTLHSKNAFRLYWLQTSL